MDDLIQEAIKNVTNAVVEPIRKIPQRKYPLELFVYPDTNQNDSRECILKCEVSVKIKGTLPNGDIETKYFFINSNDFLRCFLNVEYRNLKLLPKNDFGKILYNYWTLGLNNSEYKKDDKGYFYLVKLYFDLCKSNQFPINKDTFDIFCSLVDLRFTISDYIPKIDDLYETDGEEEDFHYVTGFTNQLDELDIMTFFPYLVSDYYNKETSNDSFQGFKYYCNTSGELFFSFLRAVFDYFFDRSLNCEILECKCCGKMFIQNHGSGKYCSTNCFNIAKNTPKTELQKTFNRIRSKLYNRIDRENDPGKRLKHEENFEYFKSSFEDIKTRFLSGEYSEEEAIKELIRIDSKLNK